MEEILKIAARICGAAEDDALLTGLCQAAYSALELRLREDVSVEDCGKAFPIAAAAMAAKAWEDGMGTAQVSSFAAGSVSLEVDQEGNRFASAAMNLLGPWLKDGEFGFRRV